MADLILVRDRYNPPAARVIKVSQGYKPQATKFILPHIQIPVSQCSVLIFLSKLDQPARQTKIQQKSLLLRIIFLKKS